MQLCILAGVVLYHQNLAKGSKIFLRIGPVDPTSPLRGDYLTLNYPDISRVEISRFTYQPVNAGDIIYLPVRQVGKLWQPIPEEKIGRTKPVMGVFLKGVVENVYADKAGILYGIESYFIPEGSGSNVKWGDNDYAVVAVDNNGNPALLQVFIDNRSFPD